MTTQTEKTQMIVIVVSMSEPLTSVVHHIICVYVPFALVSCSHGDPNWEKPPDCVLWRL